MNSIKRNFLVLILFLVFIIANSQTRYNSTIYLGAKGGVDMSQVFFNPSVPQSFKLGFVGGLTFKYIEENHFGIIAELNLEQRGWSENFEDAPFEYSRTLTYIQLPLLAHIYFGNERARFFFNAGPEIGLKVGETESSNFDVKNYENIPNFPNKNRNNRQMLLPAENIVDYGISAGLGTDIFINQKHSFSIEGRFYYGLGNVLKSGRTEEFSASNSMSIMVTLGYWFRLK